MMKKINLTEKQYNFVYLAFLVYIMVLTFLTFADTKLGIFADRMTIHHIHHFMIFYVFMPIILSIKILTWVGAVPTYEANPLKVFFPNFNAVNYPMAFKYYKILNYVLLVGTLILVYLTLNHKI